MLSLPGMLTKMMSIERQMPISVAHITAKKDNEIEELSQQMRMLVAQLSQMPQLQLARPSPIKPLTRPPPAQSMIRHSTGEPMPKCIEGSMHATVPMAQHWPTDMPSENVLGRSAEFDAWISHLRGTLYFYNARPLDMIEIHLTRRWTNFEITWCKTKANRFFHICCKTCRQYVYGSYGTSEITQDDSEEKARLHLEMFFNFEKGSNVEV